MQPGYQLRICKEGSAAAGAFLFSAWQSVFDALFMLPKNAEDLPDVGNDILRFWKGVSDVGNDIPRFWKGVPDVGNDILRFWKGVPDVGNDILRFWKSISDVGNGIPSFWKGYSGLGNGNPSFWKSIPDVENGFLRFWKGSSDGLNKTTNRVDTRNEALYTEIVTEKNFTINNSLPW